MATRIKYAGKVYESKSDAMRAMYADGRTVADVTRLMPSVGYAFAYGVAKRAGVAATAANRKPVKTATIADGTAVIRTAVGIVRVDLTTGKVTRK